MLSYQTSVGRHQAFEFFKPVEDDVDLSRPSFLLYCLDHHEPLAVGCDVLSDLFLVYNEQRSVTGDRELVSLLPA